jgi:hypothetical protein
VKSWFRIGLRLGVLAGAVFAIVLAARSRRGDGQGSLATGVHGDWPGVRPAPAPDAPPAGDHNPHGRVTVPREAAPMGAPPAVATPGPGPAEPEASEPSEHLDAEQAAAGAPAPTRRAAPRKATARKAPARSTGAPWVEPDGKACPPTHPVKAKLASRLYHLPGMLAYDRTVPDRCYADPAAAEADGFTRAKR